MTPSEPHDHEYVAGNQRHEDRGRGAREPESDSYQIKAFAKKTGFNLNTIFALVILAATGFGGKKAYEVGSSVDDVAKSHAEASAKHDLALNALAKVQGEVNSKVDVMTSQFTQLLTSQGELKAAQVVMGKNQDDLRVEIASLKASGTETKVRDMDALLRQQGEKIAKLEALLERDREKK